MVSDEYKTKYREALNLCHKLEVQCQSGQQKLNESAKTGIPARLTDTELHIFSSLQKARADLLEILRNPN